MDEIRTNLRKFIATWFSDEELDVLCFDNFPEVYDDLPSGLTKTQKVMRLLTYCFNRSQIDILLEILKKERPEKFREVFVAPVNTDTSVVHSDDSSAPDVGYIDLMERIEQHAAESKAALIRIGAAIDMIARSFVNSSEELNLLASSKQEVSRNDTKRVVNRIASELYQFGDQLEVESGLFASNFTNSIKRVADLIDISLELPDRERQVSDIATLRPVLQDTLIPQITILHGAVATLRDALVGLPRLTTDFTKSRNRALNAINDLLSELESAIGVTKDLVVRVSGIASS